MGAAGLSSSHATARSAATGQMPSLVSAVARSWAMVSRGLMYWRSVKKARRVSESTERRRRMSSRGLRAGEPEGAVDSAWAADREVRGELRVAAREEVGMGEE